MSTADASPFSSMEACRGDLGSASIRNLGDSPREARFSATSGVVAAVISSVLFRLPNWKRGCEGIYPLEPQPVGGAVAD